MSLYAKKITNSLFVLFDNSVGYILSQVITTIVNRRKGRLGVFRVYFTGGELFEERGHPYIATGALVSSPAPVP